MTEKISSSEMPDEMAILNRLRSEALDSEGVIDDRLADSAKQAFSGSEQFQEGIKDLIGNMIERDWYDKAAEIAKICGMSNSAYKQLEERYKPNPRLIG